MAINKVNYGDQTLMDLTEDTVTEDKVLEGETFHDRSGNSRVGSLVIPVQDVEVNGESVVNSEKVAEIDIPTTDIQTAVDEFETYNGGLLSECKVSLSPNQDLHGYDSPWVGGAKKNKLPLVLADIKSVNTLGTWNGNAYTIGGVTYTVGTDDGGNITDIDVDGTPTATATFYIHDKSPNFCSVDDYIFSGMNDGSSDFFMRTTTLTSSDAVISRYNLTTNTSIALPITSSVAKISVFIQVTSGTTVNHKKVYPMIRLSSVVDDTFEPYSNICPISGHTQVDVDVSDGDTTQEQVTVNLGGTYYGGTVDLVSGVMTIDRKYKKGFTRGAIDSSGKLYKIDELSDAVNITSSSGVADLDESNMGIFLGLVSARASADFCLAHFVTSFYVGGMVGKETELDTLLPNLEIIYELATPQTIQLSPTTVKALVGENHLSAPLEGQEITESKYKQMFTFDDVIAYIQSLS